MVSSKDKKPWYRSRSYWWNILTGFLGVLAMPELAGVLDPDWLKWIVFTNAFGNMFVRSITAGGVSLK